MYFSGSFLKFFLFLFSNNSLLCLGVKSVRLIAPAVNVSLPFLSLKTLAAFSSSSVKSASSSVPLWPSHLSTHCCLSESHAKPSAGFLGIITSALVKVGLPFPSMYDCASSLVLKASESSPPLLLSLTTKPLPSINCSVLTSSTSKRGWPTWGPFGLNLTFLVICSNVGAGNPLFLKYSFWKVL